ncbi:MAG TPA: XrtA system polysaccharide deacetylase [Candidatus Nanoarchaeia archaeon]|nr:XrtA system polysaccharide deacetylase [Candidatus Nanoarchaeia archaeon]
MAENLSNALTFDVEEHFQVTAFADSIGMESWDQQESRVERSCDIVLSMLAARDVRATFFCVGWVARKHPGVIRKIASAGHEVACHSYRHRPVFALMETEFRKDTYEAKSVLEDISGQAISGYRAPSFSIVGRSWWALNVLADLGFTYDSSIFPVVHPDYGMPTQSRGPFMVTTAHGTIVEFPMSTVQLAGYRAPIAGGAYLRLLPYWVTRAGMQAINREGLSTCVYLHPWELDPEQPSMQGRLTSQLRHRVGLNSTRVKLERLLRDFRFCPMRDLVQQWTATASLTAAGAVA